MSGTLTPTLVLAQSGLVQGLGLEIPGEVSSNISLYRTTTITGDLHDLVTTINSTALWPKAEMIAKLRDVMPGLAGLAHISNPRAGINANAVATSLNTHINSLFPGVKQFVGLLGSASGFCSQAAQAAKPMAEAAGKSFKDYDFNIKNYGDMLNGGLSNIFNPSRGTAGYTAGIENAASQDTDRLKENLRGLADGLRGIGTMYQLDDLFAFGEPYGLVRSLQAQGLADTSLNAKLTTAGLNPQDLEFEPANAVRAVLKEIVDPELSRIISAIGFTPPGATRIASLDDLLEAIKIFPAQSLPAIRDRNLEGLRNQLINMGGKFKTTEDLATFIEGIEVGSFSNLDTITDPLPADVAAAAAESMPKGSGEFGNPTILDMIGTVGGHKVMNALYDIRTVASSFEATLLGSNLSNAIANATVAAGLGSASITYANANLTSVLNSIDSSTNSTVVLALTTSLNSIKDIVGQLTLELDNLEKADIDLTQLSNGLGPVYSLAQSLHSYGVDAQNTGIGTLLTSMAVDNQYGDAIKAGLQEGQTIARNDAAGLRNVTKM
jgi:hypothetical protein